MARTKAFDRLQALRKASEVFHRLGYEATSLEDLVQEMGIARQSLYDTFGDKHRLFLEALAEYQARAVVGVQECLARSPSVREGVAKLLLRIADEDLEERQRGCMVVNVTAELAPRDPEVASLLGANQRALEMALRGALEMAKDRGEVAKDRDTRSLARFLISTLHGLRISAKADPDPERLREIAEVALQAVFVIKK
jgi:TetR/AcrR family transcriptional repressor of nem operon